LSLFILVSVNVTSINVCVVKLFYVNVMQIVINFRMPCNAERSTGANTANSIRDVSKISLYDPFHTL